MRSIFVGDSESAELRGVLWFAQEDTYIYIQKVYISLDIHMYMCWYGWRQICLRISSGLRMVFHLSESIESMLVNIRLSFSLFPRQAWGMKLKQLESCLSECVQPFDSPKWALEQYVTPPHLAARMLHVAAESYGDIVDKVWETEGNLLFPLTWFRLENDL